MSGVHHVQVGDKRYPPEVVVEMLKTFAREAAVLKQALDLLEQRALTRLRKGPDNGDQETLAIIKRTREVLKETAK